MNEQLKQTSTVTPSQTLPPEECNNLLSSPVTLDPLEDGISAVQLLRVSGSDLDVVNAARVSYGKFVTELTERDKKLIAFLMNHNHTSPFEHNQLSFRIKTPIYIARQWMRHRMHSYNEISYRYVNAPLEFYTPKTWRFQDKINHQGSFGEFNHPEMLQRYKASIDTAVEAYTYALEQGVCREQARGLLPVCTYTEFIFTSNLHALVHFLKLRLDKGAQWEIRQFAQAILKLALPHFPVSLQAWKDKHAPDLEL